MSDKKLVLVVGGGFGGVKAALELDKDDRFSVTLLSNDSDLRYYPTLYLTATGGKRANSSIPLSRIFANTNVKIVQGTATKLDRETKKIITAEGHELPYDVLILALGTVTNYFGIPGLKDYSYSIKSQTEAARFKTHLHQQLIETNRPDANYVIIGAGPSGVELAGALPHYLARIIKNHALKPRSLHVDIIEAESTLLPKLPRDASRAVRRQLKRSGVRLYTGGTVQGETAGALTINGKPIRSHTVVWTAGVTNNQFFADNNFLITKRNKVATDIYLQSENNIFVIGDNANTPYSGMAQTALNDGKFVASNLKRQASGKTMRSYVAKRPVTIIPVGERWAAVIWGKLRIYGWLGWVLREAADLIGFHDIEPWNLAAKQWLSEFSAQDDCIVCAIAENK